MQSPIKDQLVSLLKRENRFDTLQNSRLSKQSCSPISTSFTSPNITSDISTRDVAAQWLHEVVNDSKSPLDVFLLAVTLMDKFLELQEVTKTQVQLCASACLLIASKLRIKDDHPLLSETQIVQYTDHSIDKTELKVEEEKKFESDFDKLMTASLHSASSSIHNSLHLISAFLVVLSLLRRGN